MKNFGKYILKAVHCHHSMYQGGICRKMYHSNGCEIHGNVSNSVISANVVIEEGAIVRDSIIMDNTVIKKETVVDKAIIAENVVIGEKCTIGTGEYAEVNLIQEFMPVI